MDFLPQKIIILIASLGLHWGQVEFSGQAKGAEPIIGDRLLMEINHYTFSQRQMEVYLLVKNLINKKGEKVPIPGAENWLESVEKFKEDMFIYLEAKRLGRFQAPDEKIQSIAKDLQRQLDADPSLKNIAQRLGVDRQTLLRAAGNVVQVQEFRSLKSMNGEAGWIKNLASKYVVRSFKGSYEYRFIHPSHH